MSLAGGPHRKSGRAMRIHSVYVPTTRSTYRHTAAAHAPYLLAGEPAECDALGCPVDGHGDAAALYVKVQLETDLISLVDLHVGPRAHGGAELVTVPVEGPHHHELLAAVVGLGDHGLDARAEAGALRGRGEGGRGVGDGV